METGKSSAKSGGKKRSACFFENPGLPAPPGEATLVQMPYGRRLMLKRKFNDRNFIESPFVNTKRNHTFFTNKQQSLEFE
jgi:hypothetical protein